MNKSKEYSFYGTVIAQSIKKDSVKNRLYYEILVRKNQRYINDDDAEKKIFKLFSPKDSTYINQKVVIQYNHDNIISSIDFVKTPVNNILCISGTVYKPHIKSGPFLGINYKIDGFKKTIEKSRVAHFKNAPYLYQDIREKENFVYIFTKLDNIIGKYEFI